MKKVVYVVPILTPYAIARFQVLAKEMGIDLHVIVEKSRTDERNGSGGSYQEIKDCHTYLLESREHGYQLRNTKSGYAINESRKYSFGLRALVRKIDPDIVIVCNSTQILFLTGPRTYKLGVVVEDTPRAEEGRKPLNRWVKRMLMGTADFYIPFSEDAVEFLKRNGINHPFIRSTWSMDVDFFSDLKEEAKEEKRRELGMDERRSYIIVAGLIARKGLQQFLQGWNAMPDTFHQNNQVFIIGEGILREELTEFVRREKLENVHFLGGKPYKEVSHCLQCGDVFVLPTLEDLCSLSVLEAMAAKLPVLTTIYNGARQFVEEGRNGFIFDSENIDSITDTLSKMEAADLKAMSAASAELIQKYTNERVMGQLAKDLLAM